MDDLIDYEPSRLLQELVGDNLVENVHISGSDKVWVTYADDRGKVRGRPVAASDDDLIAIIQNLAATSNGKNTRHG